MSILSHFKNSVTNFAKICSYQAISMFLDLLVSLLAIHIATLMQANTKDSEVIREESTGRNHPLPQLLEVLHR